MIGGIILNRVQTSARALELRACPHGTTKPPLFASHTPHTSHLPANQKVGSSGRSAVSQKRVTTRFKNKNKTGSVPHDAVIIASSTK